MSLFKQQREQVRDQILETAITLFKERGYDAVSIDLITKTVGIAKGTFYNYYVTKKEILMAWSILQFEGINLGEVLSQDRTVEENLFSLAEVLTASIDKEGPLFISFLEELIRDYGNSQWVDQFDFVALFSEAMIMSSDFNKISEGLDDKLKVLNSAMFLAVIDWFKNRKTALGLSDHLKKVISICLYGMISRL